MYMYVCMYNSTNEDTLVMRINYRGILISEFTMCTKLGTGVVSIQGILIATGSIHMHVIRIRLV